MRQYFYVSNKWKTIEYEKLQIKLLVQFIKCFITSFTKSNYFKPRIVEIGKLCKYQKIKSWNIIPIFVISDD